MDDKKLTNVKELSERVKLLEYSSVTEQNNIKDDESIAKKYEELKKMYNSLLARIKTIEWRLNL